MKQYKNWLEILRIAHNISEDAESRIESTLAVKARDIAATALEKTGFPYFSTNNTVTRGDMEEGIVGEEGFEEEDFKNEEGEENEEKDDEKSEDEEFPEKKAEHGTHEGFGFLVFENTGTESDFDNFPKRAGRASVKKTSPAQVLPAIDPEEERLNENAYPESIYENNITRSYHMIVVYDENKNVAVKAEVLISPLKLRKSGEVPIIAWAYGDKKTQTKTSPGNWDSVLLRVGDIDIVVGGHFEDGRFVGTCSLTKKFIEAGYTIQQQTKRQDGLGHIRIKDKGIEVRAIPLSKTNMDNGIAEFVYGIYQNGKEPVVGDNLNVPDVRFVHEGKTFCFVTKWNEEDSKLYGVVYPV